jgi:hypothetical protein
VTGLPVDIWLAPHTFMFGMAQKFEKNQQPGAANAYINPDGYRTSSWRGGTTSWKSSAVR